MKFFLFAGLPSSGKTYLATLLKAKLGGYLIDDPKNPGDLENFPVDAKIVYVTDPYFCLPKVRSRVEERLYGKYPDCDIEWIFFENNPEQCRKNVVARNDGRNVEASIRRFGREYVFPENVPLYPCYSSEVDFEKIADEISYYYWVDKILEENK